MAEPAPHQDTGVDPRLDRIAWDVLTDLIRRHQGLGDLTAEGLRRLIALRLDQEAAEAGVSPSSMGAAFDRVLLEFIGADRPPRDGPEPDEGPLETVDDL